MQMEVMFKYSNGIVIMRVHCTVIFYFDLSFLLQYWYLFMYPVSYQCCKHIFTVCSMEFYCVTSPCICAIVQNKQTEEFEELLDRQ